MNRLGLHSFAVRATLPLCILVLSLASAVACVCYAFDTRPSCDLEGAQRGVGVRAIEEITVGDRVVGEHPTGEFDVSLGTEVNPRTWKKIVLAANKADGSTADVVLLRPDWWVQEHSAEPFNIIPIHVPECGIDGDAMVLDIGPCPRIKPGTAPIVIGCFRHQSAEVIDISVDGAGEPIGTTANHPIWSEDRVAFVRADALSIGERVRLRDGVARLTSIAPRGPPEPVYNIEVLGHHVYHVGQSGLLVHNGGPCPEFIARVHQLRSQGLKGDDLRRAIEVEFPPVRDTPGGRVGSVHADLPVRNGSGPTHGIFNDSKPLMSGRSGGDAADVFKSRMSQLSDDARTSLKHVEGHAAAEMVRDGLSEGVLHINYKTGPCGFCRSGVPELLEDGQELWVVFPDGAGYFTNNGWFPQM